jgi:hypothetical protein
MHIKKIMFFSVCTILTIAAGGQTLPRHDWPGVPPLPPTPKGAGLFTTGQSAVAAGSGSNIFVGYTNTGTLVDAVVWKVNSRGRVLWRRTVGGTGADYLFHVERTPDGHFLAAGYTTSPEWVTGYSDMLLVKFNTKGRILWRKTFGTSGEISYAFSCGVGPDGGYFAFGTHGSSAAKFMLLKIDKFGNEYWRTSYDLGSHEFGSTAVATSDGGFLLFGEGINPATSSTDLLLVKTDNRGQYLDHRYYGDDTGTQWAYFSSPPTGNALIETPATSEYPAGFVFCGIDYTTMNIVVCRVDGRDLSEVWYRQYSGDWPGEDYYSAYAVRHMGSNLLVAGSDLYDGDEAGQLWMLDVFGNQEWADWYSPQGEWGDALYFLLPLFDQTFLAGGRMLDSSYDYHFYLARCFRDQGYIKWERFID